MGILLGLLSALGWGSADFLARSATRAVGTYRTILYTQMVGFVALGVYMIADGELARRVALATAGDWAWAGVFTAGYLAATFALYRAFEVCTEMSVVSPIAASYAAITVMLAVITGEHLSPARAVGIVLALAGVVLTAVNLRRGLGSVFRSRRGLDAGIGWALAASLGYGVMFWLLGVRIAPALGPVLPVWLVRVAAVVGLALLSAPLSVRVVPVPWSALRLLFVVGALDTLATVAGFAGMLTDQVSVVAVLGSLFTAVTVLLSWVFLHERLAPNQWMGIALVLASLVLVAV